MAFNWGKLLEVGGNIASNVIPAVMASGAAKSAAKRTEQATTATSQQLDRALADIRREADRTRADYEPWRKAGVNALQWLEKLNTPGAVDPALIEGYVTGLPGYQFAEDELTKAIDRRHAASGDRFSGRGMKEMVRWKDRYLLDPAMKNWLGQLGQLAGYGPAATQSQGAAGMGAARSGADIASMIGNLGLTAADQRGQADLASQLMYGNALKGVMDDVFASMRA